MKTISLSFTAKKSAYTIFIGEHLLGNISEYIPTEQYSNIFIITDTNVTRHFLTTVLQGLPKNTKHIAISPGEKEKSITTLQHIWQTMIDAKCDRKTLVINLGGGVIGDMGGFAASTYMRGVDFINIPTTLLSQVDESVGGKTMINFGGIKNNIGTFTQPSGVIIDIATLRTLPKREFLSGFAEIIKHGIIANESYFQKVTKKHPLKYREKELIEIIEGSCKIKKQIVQADETESNLRKSLNYGHTIGHAIEALSLETATPLLHGEAISIGMVAEANIAFEKGLLSSQDYESIKTGFINADLPIVLPVNLKLSRKNKSVSISTTEKSIGYEAGVLITPQTVIEKMLQDKKNEKGIINFTLPTRLGTVVTNQHVSSDLIEKVLEEIL